MVGNFVRISENGEKFFDFPLTTSMIARGYPNGAVTSVAGFVMSEDESTNFLKNNTNFIVEIDGILLGQRECRNIRVGPELPFGTAVRFDFDNQ